MSTGDKVIVKHTFQAKPEVIFKAWTTPTLMQLWMDGTCDDFASVATQVKADPRVGGCFEILMQGRHLHTGEYREVDPPKRLVFTWNSTFAHQTLVTVELKGVGGTTELTLTHERLTNDAIPSHQQGWTRVLRHLDTVLTKGVL